MEFTDRELRVAKDIWKKVDSSNNAFEALPLLKQLELVLRVYRHKFHALLDDGPEKLVFAVRGLLIDRDGIATVTGELDGESQLLVLPRSGSDNITQKIDLSQIGHCYDCELNGLKYLLVFDENTKLE